MRSFADVIPRPLKFQKSAMPAVTCEGHNLKESATIAVDSNFENGGDTNGFHEDSTDLHELTAKLEKYDQTHLLKFYDQLPHEQQLLLLQDISNVDFEDIIAFFQQVRHCICFLY